MLLVGKIIVIVAWKVKRDARTAGGEGEDSLTHRFVICCVIRKARLANANGKNNNVK